MDASDQTRHAAATDLHRAALTCLEALRARVDPARLAAIAGHSPRLAMGVELRAAAPTLLLMARPAEGMLPQEVMRIEKAEFTDDEIRLASVAAAVTAMLLQGLDKDSRSQVVRLLKSDRGYLSLYVLPEPFEAALELHAGIEVTELARVAGERIGARIH